MNSGSMKRVLVFFGCFVLLLSQAHAFESNVHLPLIGVQETDEGAIGAIASLDVEVHDGEGRVFLDTLPLTKIDTQASARLAKDVACLSLRIDCKAYDFFYVIRSNAPIIGGPSAGASMAVATMAALTKTPVMSDVIMTGTINPDGSIGTIGSAFEKVQAAYNGGFSRVLVPPTQSFDVIDGVLTNISEYAQTTWNVSVQEAEDVEYAFEAFTGYAIEQEMTNQSELINSLYTSVMYAMSSRLVNYVSVLYENTTRVFGMSNASDALKDEVKEILDARNQSIQNITSYIAKEEYYVAASKALQTSIDVRYASFLLSYDTALSKNEFVNQTLANISQEIAAWELSMSRNKTLHNLNAVELFMTALDRFYESKYLLESAYNAQNTNDVFGALYNAAVAKERLQTAETWLSSIDALPNTTTIEFSFDAIAELANERVSQAESSLTYASTVIDGLDGSGLSQTLNSAQTYLFEENYVRAIFEALKARGDANLVMEVRNLNEEALINLYERKRALALNSIAREKERGTLPLLSLAYVTFAQDHKKSNNVVDALRYVNYAYQYAGLSSSVIDALDLSQLQDESVRLISFKILRFDELGANPVYFSLGVLAGAFIILFLVYARR
ncbi:hypothetical protein COT72_00045 [archaeon CG10_big_fil_rev_8_21_14_0_10_43_11]|nr:MAG: hypothetical protein COT72_00045 [archaeon CG10_big_fil_rev_8_21_14_0_10_43_11]